MEIINEKSTFEILNNNIIFKKIIQNIKNRKILIILFILNNYLLINYIINEKKNYFINLYLYKKSFYKNLNYIEMNTFIKINNNGDLIYSIPKAVNNNPKITALIPLFNAQKSLKSTIRSIQNQNFEEIEIILVDDFSNDNTIKLVNLLQKEDLRIKLIKNKRNRGTLYTRSIGALNAKGKYIMTIDNDDLFLRDIFNICYEEAENNNIDIIEFSGCYKSFKGFISKNYCKICFFLRFKEDGVIINQPELSNFIYKKGNNNNYKIIDAYLWGKCIKSVIYTKAIKMIGEEIYTKNVCWCEDRIVNFYLFRIANSFKFIKRYGIIHNYNRESVVNKWKRVNVIRIFHDELINVMSIYNITKSSKDVEFAAFEFKKYWNHYASSSLTQDNKLLAKNIFCKLINNTYISEYYKNQLINITNNKLN